MISALVSGVVAGYGVALPVGPIAVLIAGLSARESLWVGAAAGMGAATADLVYAALAVLGGAAIAGVIEPVATPLRWAGAAVLMVMAARIAWSARSAASVDRRLGRTTPLGAYLGVLGLTLLNPATIAYFAALVLGRGGEGGGLWFVVGAFLASASWQLVIAASGALAGRYLTSPKAKMITALGSSAVIVALAVGLML
ncbi:LysE family transporter [Actinoplanes sp. TFC3]|uniref:LysE family transporter n=1 Tax=Actinoplanes sp. TFC3 TaxID=1710355 RepID=UPI000835695F|nr:LysE family transporter [Actinoplanes sp. TFC3]